MSFPQLLALLGLLLNIVGVGVLFLIKVRTRERDEAESHLPRDHYIKDFDAALTDSPVRPPTESEERYENARLLIHPAGALNIVRAVGVLIILGFAFQAAALLV
jgi:hypothetical protein